MEPQLTIAAISTPPGIGGIAVIRISGPDAINIVNSAWKGSDLNTVKSHTAHLGKYIDTNGRLLDEAVASVFISPKSFTGENTVELSVHGSSYIQREILADLVKRGASIAAPGEFTKRAFLNGKIDLAQAEGIADLISSSSKAAHDMAVNQTRGFFSREFNLLRDKLIDFASLLELELDFSEEDVEFANRKDLIKLCEEILAKVDHLAASYSRGAVLKEGVPVAIAGIPNAGKSSLLNILVGEEKAIVTDIPGTTRDLIEDTAEIEGIFYRFIDTAGLRETDDLVEGIGVDKAKTAIDKAYIVVWLIDPTQEMAPQIEALQNFQQANPLKHVIILLTKSDLHQTLSTEKLKANLEHKYRPIRFSAKNSEGLNELLNQLKDISTSGSNPTTDIIVTNARHYEALVKASEALKRALTSLSPKGNDLEQEIETQPFTDAIPTDFIAQDIRESISYLSLITGNITTDDLLQTIFSRFCIGK